tara:strand:+ start:162174 stop:162605 length:432 start_codon:yes stop_codon:yes gene_type:complete
MLLVDQSNKLSRVYSSRDNTLMSLWVVDGDRRMLMLSFESEMMPSGYVLLTDQEIKYFAESLSRFFVDGKFEYTTPHERSQGLPEVTMATTNWGEPYDEGLVFAFHKHPDDLEHLGFALVARDVKDLHNWLQGCLAGEADHVG